MNIKVKNKIYELPLSELYSEQFKEINDNNCIVLDNIPLEKKYSYLNKIFNYVSNYMSMVFDYSNVEFYNYKKNIDYIIKKINSVDRMQFYYYKNQKVDKSIEIIESFLVEMLELSNYLTNINNFDIDNRIK